MLHSASLIDRDQGSFRLVSCGYVIIQGSEQDDPHPLIHFTPIFELVIFFALAFAHELVDRLPLPPNQGLDILLYPLDP